VFVPWAEEYDRDFDSEGAPWWSMETEIAAVRSLLSDIVLAGRVLPRGAAEMAAAHASSTIEIQLVDLLSGNTAGFDIWSAERVLSSVLAVEGVGQIDDCNDGTCYILPMELVAEEAMKAEFIQLGVDMLVMFRPECAVARRISIVLRPTHCAIPGDVFCDADTAWNHI